MAAAERGDVNILRELDKENQVDDVIRGLALAEAASAGKKQAVLFLLKAGQISSFSRGSAMLQAARHGHSNIVLIFLRNKIPVDFSSAGKTALMEASQHGWVELAKLLLANGAKVGKKLQGKSAFDYALENRQMKIIELPEFLPYAKKWQEAYESKSESTPVETPVEVSWTATLLVGGAIAALIGAGFLWTAYKTSKHGDCPVCQEKIGPAAKTFFQCKHLFCSDCVTGLINAVNKDKGAFVEWLRTMRQLPNPNNFAPFLRPLMGRLNMVAMAAQAGDNIQTYLSTLDGGKWKGQELVCPLCRAAVDPDAVSFTEF